jgi:arylsulfatase A-like enzyme
MIKTISRTAMLAGLALLFTLSAIEPCLAAKSKPNIIFVLTDDQGYGDAGCHGNPILKTPNIDKLHSQSVRFTDFQVSPSCAPTRCSLMTGMHEFKSGVTHTIEPYRNMNTESYTIAQALQSAGYVTGIFGKWHLGLKNGRAIDD